MHFKEMIRFAPIYQSRIWGGRRLEEDFDRLIPDGHIGESWELVDLEGELQSVAIGPLFEGQKLGEIWRSGALGGSASGDFPFLLKWLDTNDILSVQVHPDAKAVELLGEGA
ncbi:mannose-6-phosphate isomerase, partial [Myxococcota bacterium]|nr:mannose-6-phosphate isomerase [Myxococcota bacterium]